MSVIYKALRSIESDGGVDDSGFNSSSAEQQKGSNRSGSQVVFVLVSIGVLVISGVSAGFAWQWSTYNESNQPVASVAVITEKSSVERQDDFATKIISINEPVSSVDSVNLKSSFAQKDGVSAVVDTASLNTLEETKQPVEDILKINKDIIASTQKQGGIKQSDLKFQPVSIDESNNALKSSALLSKVLAEFKQSVEPTVATVAIVKQAETQPTQQLTQNNQVTNVPPVSSEKIFISLAGQAVPESLPNMDVGVIKVASNGTVNSFVEQEIKPLTRNKKDPIFYSAEIQTARQRPVVRTTGTQDTNRIRILRINLDRALQNRDQQEIRAVLMHLQSMVGIDSSYMLKIRAYVQVALGGDMEYAIDLLRQVLVRNPRDKDASMNMAVAEISLGRNESARDRLNRLSAQYPDDAQIITLLNSIP